MTAIAVAAKLIAAMALAAAMLASLASAAGGAADRIAAKAPPLSARMCLFTIL